MSKRNSGRGGSTGRHSAGLAVRKEITIRFTGGALTHSMSLLLYLPAGAGKPVPVFLGLNFGGNHTISADPGITVTGSWVRTNVESGVMDHAATPLSRGVDSSSWPVERILERGYGLATIYYGDIDPDFDDGFKNGVHPLFYARVRPGRRPTSGARSRPGPGACRRAMDYLQTDPDIDAEHVAVMGHSRLGQDGPVGRGDRRAVRDRDLQQFRLRRGGAVEADLRRDRRHHQHDFPPLVLRQLQEVQRPRGRRCPSTSTC